MCENIPIISVCMATYNGSKYIEQQINSILPQLGNHDELVISDNSSSDNTLDIARNFGDSRIKIFICKRFGVVSNFENALVQARGKFIFLADQDDIWIPGRVDAMIDSLQNSQLVMSDAIIMSASLDFSSHAKTLFQIVPPSKSIAVNMMKNTFTGCCMAFNRDILKAALPFPYKLPMHDWWIGLIGLSIGSIIYINKPYLYYRRHESNASTLSLSSKFSILKRVAMRWHIATRLFLRLTSLQLK